MMDSTWVVLARNHKTPHLVRPCRAFTDESLAHDYAASMEEYFDAWSYSVYEVPLHSTPVEAVIL